MLPGEQERRGLYLVYWDRIFSNFDSKLTAGEFIFSLFRWATIYLIVNFAVAIAIFKGIFFAIIGGNISWGLGSIIILAFLQATVPVVFDVIMRVLLAA